MITAVDSSVLLDVILDDPVFRDGSLKALKQCRASGALIVCPVVWAEVRAALREPEHIGALLSRSGVGFDPFDQFCSDLAGDLWREYRRRGGRREHLIPDFLVGAHAQTRRARLLARDRGFFRRYFSRLDVLEPQPPT